MDITRLVEQSVEKQMAPYIEKMTELDNRVSALERSMSLLTEVQVDMLKRTSSLQEEVKLIHQKGTLLENAPRLFILINFFLINTNKTTILAKLALKNSAVL
ncbi:hypothetical protein MUB15_07385 [Priestia sp. OVS21]|nr:hypothetical protein [Priestia sp. OVS21]